MRALKAIRLMKLTKMLRLGRLKRILADRLGTNEIFKQWMGVAGAGQPQPDFISCTFSPVLLVLGSKINVVAVRARHAVWDILYRAHAGLLFLLHRRQRRVPQKRARPHLLPAPYSRKKFQGAETAPNGL